MPYLRLVSQDSETVSFMVVDPFPIYPDYEPTITQQDLEDLGVGREAKLIILTIVNRHERPFTMNLQAPLLIYWHKRRAKQLLFPGVSDFPIRI